MSGVEHENNNMKIVDYSGHKSHNVNTTHAFGCMVSARIKFIEPLLRLFDCFASTGVEDDMPPPKTEV